MLRMGHMGTLGTHDADAFGGLLKQVLDHGGHALHGVSLVTVERELIAALKVFTRLGMKERRRYSSRSFPNSDSRREGRMTTKDARHLAALKRRLDRARARRSRALDALETAEGESSEAWSAYHKTLHELHPEQKPKPGILDSIAVDYMPPSRATDSFLQVSEQGAGGYIVWERDPVQD